MHRLPPRPSALTLLGLSLSCLTLSACGADGGAAARSSPTWHQEVAPLVTRSCTGCHRAGGIAPFDLTDVETAKRMAPLMAAAVEAGRMPPWAADETAECKPRFRFKGDLRLSAQDKATITDWARAGAPEGDAASAAPLPVPEEAALSDRNARVTLARPVTVGGDQDQFRCFVLPHRFEEDVWIQGSHVVPGNPRVVHHVLTYIDSAGKSDALVGADGSYTCVGGPGFDAEMLNAWAPGTNPLVSPAAAGIKVKKGSRLVMQVHYHPVPGRDETDATSLDLRWTTTPPPFEIEIALIGNFTTRDAATGDGLLPGPSDPPGAVEFKIPAGARGHVEAMQYTVPKKNLYGARLYGIGTHMHYVGTDMKISIDRRGRQDGPPAAEPADECLIQTPRWDFNWQRAYAYDAPFDTLPSVFPGDKLLFRCTYDNSTQNPKVSTALHGPGLHAPRDVGLGEMTLDEMCLGAFGLVTARVQ